MSCDNIFLNEINGDGSVLMQNQNGLSLKECQMQCEDEPECQSYYYDSKRQCSLLHTGYKAILKSSNSIGAPKNCTLLTFFCVGFFQR